jgi:hypothetical protein
MYKDELTKAMTYLGGMDNTVFIGQQMRYPGNGLYPTLEGVPLNKKIEIGVCEDTQLGIATGLAHAGKLPICVFPRMDFLLCAMNQLINHLDKYPVRVIIRTCVGSRTPLDPGYQHRGDYVEGLRHLINTQSGDDSYVQIVNLKSPYFIFEEYMYAAGIRVDRPAESCGYHQLVTILVERADLYGME